MADIVIIGGGAAGMMAAIAAASAESGGENRGEHHGENHVLVVEKNDKLGRKLFITGKGRCNVTNACDTEDFFQNVMEHSKFLYSAVYGFDNHAVMEFFEQAGCPLKVERGQRVFPQSDHSSDIIKALEQELRRLGVQVLLNTEVKKVKTVPLAEKSEAHSVEAADSEPAKKKRRGRQKQQRSSKITGIEIRDRRTGKRSELRADRLIVATGGCSYILTGSTGDGYQFAKTCGHSIVPTLPALVPFSIKEDWCHALQGLSLKNVQVCLEADGKQIYSDFGEMLFTHYGVSGPLMLSASSHYVHRACREGSATGEAVLLVDLKPALTCEQLDKRILREFDSNKNKQLKNVIGSLFPAKLVPVMPLLAGIDPDRRVNEITKEERERFVHTIKHIRLTITGVRDYNEAVITKGGVSTGEVSPSTMESKLVSGLYFAGEVLDLDALTGGFNLQIAWSTGYLAGRSAAACNE
ncbi:MAG: NAD(P)/FAD-dependent oxidoreductase [Lachnospiraceae bacterium]|nr:NAD(P)/FAD-dependent oxidoreductase [Lachnospiraceae bacterium]